jgi:hypothetical protein
MKKTPPIPKDIELFIKLYEQSRRELIKTITQSEQEGGIARFQRSLLAQVDENIEKLNKLSTKQGKKLTKKYYLQGVYEAEERFKSYGLKEISVSFSKIHEPALTELIKNLNETLTEANYFVGRKIKDEIRDASLKASALKLSTGKTVEEATRMLHTNFLVKGLTGFKDSAGRMWNLDAYAGMVIRSTTREATNGGTLNHITGAGEDLVQVSQHNSPCNICSAYEGRVYSISGKNKNYPPLDAMFSGDYLNIHPNCVHVLTPYIEKYEDFEKDRKFSNRPFTIPDKDSKKLEAYNQAQKEKRQLRTDKMQYEKYKTLLKGKDKGVLTFNKFRETKEDPDKWTELKSKYRKELAELKKAA